MKLRYIACAVLFFLNTPTNAMVHPEDAIIEHHPVAVIINTDDERINFERQERRALELLICSVCWIMAMGAYLLCHRAIMA